MLAAAGICGASSSQAPYLSHTCRDKSVHIGSRSLRCSSSPPKVCRTFRGPRNYVSPHPPRRHKLHIFRACAFKKRFEQALNHSAAPPLPKKTVGLFRDPVIMFRHTRPSGFAPRKAWSSHSLSHRDTPCFLISPPRCIVHRTRFGGSTLRFRRGPIGRSLRSD